MAEPKARSTYHTAMVLALLYVQSGEKSLFVSVDTLRAAALHDGDSIFMRRLHEELADMGLVLADYQEGYCLMRIPVAETIDVADLGKLADADLENKESLWGRLDKAGYIKQG